MTATSKPRPRDEGPTPIEGDISGGLSDKTILSISLGGFLLVGLTLYVLVLRKSNEAEGEDDGEPKRTYEEELDDADPRTLNRAQRRARAKNRMKKKRRIAQERPAAAGDGENGDGAIVAANEVVAVEDDGSAAQPVRHMSRKERVKAAKEAEREERKQFEEERREQQREAEEVAINERKAREKEEENRKREEKEKRDQAEYEAWKTMFVSDEAGEESATTSVTVRDFVDYVKCRKVVGINDVATHFRVEAKFVLERIRKLEEEGRICGVIDEQGNFVYLAADVMRTIADSIKAKGKLSFSELAREIELLINANEDGDAGEGLSPAELARD